MMFWKEKIAGWANHPVVEAEVARPGSEAALREVLLKKDRLIARGNGRSYGDASLAATVVETRKLNKLLDFDPKTGLLTCQSGILLSEILDWSLPRGWFLQVAPGTKLITVGGAVAADVHGKNHPTAGSFSRSLDSFRLMTADGSVLNCSRAKNAELFWKTVGGMGFTGIVTEANFRLRPNSSLKMRQVTEKAASLPALFDLFEKNTATYAAAWVDCLNKKGRSILFSGEHVEGDGNSLPADSPRKPPAAAPRLALPKLLNSLTINAYNHAYWLSNRRGEREVPLDNFFFPLDSVPGWNRFYGPKGFVQYHFWLPETASRTGMERMLEAVRSSGQSPFLAVLKKYGDREPEALNSFPERGYSLAMDFPMHPNLMALVKKLDGILLDLGGKIYLAKDAASDPLLSGLRPENFPEQRFESMLRRRIFAGA